MARVLGYFFCMNYIGGKRNHHDSIMVLVVKYLLLFVFIASISNKVLG
jgi:hypothetical protein